MTSQIYGPLGSRGESNSSRGAVAYGRRLPIPSGGCSFVGGQGLEPLIFNRKLLTQKNYEQRNSPVATRIVYAIVRSTYSLTICRASSKVPTFITRLHICKEWRSASSRARCLSIGVFFSSTALRSAWLLIFERASCRISQSSCCSIKDFDITKFGFINLAMR